jgi:hypothetical protein
VSLSAPDQSPPAGHEPGGVELVLQAIKALAPAQKRLLLFGATRIGGRPPEGSRGDTDDAGGSVA